MTPKQLASLSGNVPKAVQLTTRSAKKSAELVKLSEQLAALHTVVDDLTVPMRIRLSLRCWSSVGFSCMGHCFGQWRGKRGVASVSTADTLVEGVKRGQVITRPVQIA